MSLRVSVLWTGRARGEALTLTRRVRMGPGADADEEERCVSATLLREVGVAAASLPPLDP